MQISSPPIKMVALGDSLTAGMQDACLDARSQSMAYTKQLADQAEIPFNMPVVDKLGIPPRLFLGPDVDVPRVLKDYALLGAAAAPAYVWLQLLGIPPHALMDAIYATPDMGQRTADSLDTPQHPQGNFAVPGYEIRHIDGVRHVDDFLAEERSGAAQDIWFPILPPLIHAVIQNGTDEARGSEVDQAIRQDPDLVVLWPGNNDALEPVGGGVVDDRVLTPLDDRKWRYYSHNLLTDRWTVKETADVQPGFASSLRNLVDRLERNTHAEIMLFDIPDVTVIPFLKPLGAPIGTLPFHVVLPDGTDVTREIEGLQLPDRVRGAGHGGRARFPEGSRVGLGTIIAKLASLVAPVKGGAAPDGPRNRTEFDVAVRRFKDEAVFSENDVLDPDELGTISGRIQQYNDLMRDMAATHPRLHLIDDHALLEQMQADGRDLIGAGDPVRITNTFTGAHDARGYGGIFSFDGVHPSDVGHAVLANVLLDRIQQDLGGNERFRRFLDVPRINEKFVYNHDPHQNGDDFRIVLSRAGAARLHRL